MIFKIMLIVSYTMVIRNTPTFHSDEMDHFILVITTIQSAFHTTITKIIIFNNHFIFDNVEGMHASLRLNLWAFL